MAETLHALVRNGSLLETRMVDPASVPAHKLDTDGGKILRPFNEVPRPDYEPALEDATVEVVVTQEAVNQVWSITRKPLAEQRQAVKDECGRRIYTPFPQWKQANYTARAAELLEKQVMGETLTQQEAAEMAYLKSVWSWIKSVRLASDMLEAMDPVPADYRDDANWPTAWSE